MLVLQIIIVFVSRIAAVVVLVVGVRIAADHTAALAGFGIAVVHTLGFGLGGFGFGCCALGRFGFRFPKKHTALTGLGG